MEPSSNKSIDGEAVANFLKQVDHIAKENNLEASVFVKKGTAASIFSNVRDPEEAGSIITASIMHSLIESDTPETANNYIEVLIAAAAHTIESLKGLKQNVMNKIFPKLNFKC